MLSTSYPYQVHTPSPFGQPVPNFSSLPSKIFSLYSLSNILSVSSGAFNIRCLDFEFGQHDPWSQDPLSGLLSRHWTSTPGSGKWGRTWPWRTMSHPSPVLWSHQHPQPPECPSKASETLPTNSEVDSCDRSLGTLGREAGLVATRRRRAKSWHAVALGQEQGIGRRRGRFSCRARVLHAVLIGLKNTFPS